MAKWHGISRRKATGGRLKRPNRYRGKRRTEISSETQYAFVGSEDAFNNPENSMVLLDMSCQKDALSSARQILEDNGLDNTWGSMLLEKLLEDALKDLSFDPEPESHNAISYIKELDEMDIETAA